MKRDERTSSLDVNRQSRQVCMQIFRQDHDGNTLRSFSFFPWDTVMSSGSEDQSCRNLISQYYSCALVSLSVLPSWITSYLQHHRKGSCTLTNPAALILQLTWWSGRTREMLKYHNTMPELQTIKHLPLPFLRGCQGHLERKRACFHFTHLQCKCAYNHLFFQNSNKFTPCIFNTLGKKGLFVPVGGKTAYS